MPINISLAKENIIRITAEISLYPLNENFVADIREFVQLLREQLGIELITNQMSTQLTGEYDAVTGAVQRCMRQSMERHGTMVFVVKYLNADLEIASEPQI